MSTCISRHGEFGQHIPDELNGCTRCGVLDEDALRAELERLRSDYEARGSVIESLKREATQVSLVARRAMKAELAAEKNRTAAAIARNARLWARLEAEEAELQRLLPVVEKAKAWRARILSDGEYATEDADDLAAAVDALGTDAADGAGTGEQRADVVMTGVKALLEHAGALERREPHCERCASIGHEAAHPQLDCGDVGCYADHEPVASPAGSSTAEGAAR